MMSFFESVCLIGSLNILCSCNCFSLNIVYCHVYFHKAQNVSRKAFQTLFKHHGAESKPTFGLTPSSGSNRNTGFKPSYRIITSFANQASSVSPAFLPVFALHIMAPSGGSVQTHQSSQNNKPQMNFTQIVSKLNNKS